MIDAALFARLTERARRASQDSDPAHDFSHVARVVSSARLIAQREGIDVAVPTVAALLHELFSYPKGHPDSPRSGFVCAEHAREVLSAERAPEAIIEPVCTAIREHPFSLGVTPKDLGARVLQDADRLDALGAIGLARMWATCASMGSPFYADVDPFCASREPDDKRFGLDHVYKKLLKLPDGLHTAAARSMAEDRVSFMRDYLAQLERELGEAGALAVSGP